MHNVQTYDFGSLNNLGTPLLKWEMEKTKGFLFFEQLGIGGF